MKISPHSSSGPFFPGHLGFQAAVIPGEEWNDPKIFQAQRFRDDTELFTKIQNELKFLDRVNVGVSDPEFVIAGCEE